MESIPTLNSRLVDEFGIDTVTGLPMFRIVWSDDQIEKRMVDTLDNGVQLLHPMVREVRKYPYLPHLYVLERLVAVPEVNQEELPASKVSYEPIWAYRDEHDGYLFPVWPATKFIVDCLYAAMGEKSLAKYVDDAKNTTPEGREQRITELAQELFGDETETGDAMRYGEAIVVPSSYNKDEKES